MTFDLSFWQALITFLVPMLIWGTKSLLPKIPKAVLPILAPLLGAGLELIPYLTGISGTGNPVLGAIFGGLGVWLREVVDQLKKQVVGTPA